MAYKVIRFRGVDYIDRCWHTTALWKMLRAMEKDEDVIHDVWIPLLEEGVELVEYGYADGLDGPVYDLEPMFGDSILNYADGVY